jgi:hypothetical protein
LKKSIPSILLSLAAIIVCGGAGAIAAFVLVQAIGIGGVLGAFVAVVVAIAVATLLWALGVALLRSLRILK